MKPVSPRFSADEFRAMATYDSETGELRWTANAAYQCRVGALIGSKTSKGYLRAAVRRQHILVHRLAWYHYYGEWPPGQIDHINRVKHDNRISNLRVVTNAENQTNVGAKRNNTSGVVGVQFNKDGRNWRPFIVIDKWVKYLGSYANFEDATAVRKAAEAKYYIARANRMDGAS